jgi:hypothetical protein
LFQLLSYRIVSAVNKAGEASPQNGLLKIGELAEQADVAVGTIRYYESLGLVEPMHPAIPNSNLNRAFLVAYSVTLDFILNKLTINQEMHRSQRSRNF